MPTLVRRPFPLAIITDFGYRDHYVGAMKGVIATIAPGATVIDITHGIPAQSIVGGAIALREVQLEGKRPMSGGEFVRGHRWIALPIS